MKVKQCLVEEKKHIRFYDWSTHDVSKETAKYQSLCYVTLFLLSDRGSQQILIPYLKACHLFGKPFGQGFHSEEEQMAH